MDLRSNVSKRSWTRSGNVKKLQYPKLSHKEPKSTIGKKSHNTSIYNSNVSDDSFKQHQRDRNVKYMTDSNNTGLGIAIDSVDGIIFKMLEKECEKIAKNGGQIPTGLVCINGESGYAKICRRISKYGIKTYNMDIYDFMDSLDDGTKISHIWLDTMSGYFAKFTGFESTQSLLKLLHNKNLFNKTRISLNTNHMRHNVSGLYEKTRVGGDPTRPEKHFDEISLDFMQYGYKTTETIIGNIPDLYIKYKKNMKIVSCKPAKHIIYTDQRGNSTYLYQYRDEDKQQNYIYHEFIVSELEKNSIIIDLD